MQAERGQEIPGEAAQKLPEQIKQLQKSSQELIDLGNAKEPNLVQQLLPVIDVSTITTPASLTADAAAVAGSPQPDLALQNSCTARRSTRRV